MTERANHGHHAIEHIHSKGDFLFDPTSLTPTLKGLSISNDKLQQNIYQGKYRLRPLALSDYYHGYMDLLRQLTECGSVMFDQFRKRFQQMKECPESYYILVIEDTHLNQQIIGSATLVCEKKFIRQLAVRGRIEDVVVNDRYRGQQLGKLLIDVLTNFARDHCECYKVSLECKDELVRFYEQFGYRHEEKQNYLCQRFTQQPTEKTQTNEQWSILISKLIVCHFYRIIFNGNKLFLRTRLELWKGEQETEDRQ